MKSLLVLAIASALALTVSADCDACIDEQCYIKHVIPGKFKGYPGIDINTSTLLTTKDSFRLITKYNLDTEIYSGKDNILELWDFTVDQSTGDIYATGPWRSGIYKVDLVNGKRDLLVDKNVIYITFKDKLYYSVSKGGIFTFEGEESLIIPGTEGFDIIYFIVDKKGDIYFEHVSGSKHAVLKLLKGAVNPTYFCDDTYRMTTDKDDNAIFISQLTYAVYRVIDNELVDVGAVTDRFNKPRFDKYNNLIYYLSTKGIAHLKQKKNTNCSTSTLGNIKIITEIGVSVENTNEISSLAEFIDVTTSSTHDGSDGNNSGVHIEDGVNTSTQDINEAVTGTTSMQEIYEAVTETTRNPEIHGVDEITSSNSEIYKVGGTTITIHRENGRNKEHPEIHEEESTKRDDKDRSCNCKQPKLPNINIKIEFN